MTAEYNALGKKESNGDKTKFRVIGEHSSAELKVGDGDDTVLSSYDTDKGAMRRKAEELSKSLNLLVRILTTDEEVGALPTMRKRNSKGFYDESADRRGEEAITIVLPNHVNVADVVRTVFHEGVWHKGVAALY